MKKLLLLAVIFTPSFAFAQSSGIAWKNGSVLTAQQLQQLDNAKINTSRIGAANGVAPLDANKMMSAAVSGDVSGATATPDGKTVSQIGQIASGSVQQTEKNAANGVAGLDATGSVTAPVTGDVSAAVATATGASASRTIADRAADVINIKDYGAVGDGTTDDTAAMLRVQAQAQTLLSAGTPVAIDIPPGIYLVSQSLTFDASNANLSITGMGRGVSTLAYTAAVDGISVTLSASTSADIDRIGILRKYVGAKGNTALSIKSSAFQSNGTAYLTRSYIGPFGESSTYADWSVNAHFTSISTPTVAGVKLFQQYPGNTDDSSSLLQIDGAATAIFSINAKISDSTFQGGYAGIRVGDWVQGVFVTNSDILGNVEGIRWIPDDDTDTEYLSISNSHINPSKYGVNISNGDGLITNCYILEFNQGIQFMGVHATNMSNFSVIGSTIRSSSASASLDNIGINYTGTGQWGNFTGNSFDNFYTSIQLDGSAWATISANVYSNNVNKIIDNAGNPGTNISDIYEISTAGAYTIKASTLTIDAYNVLVNGSLLPSKTASYQLGAGNFVWKGLWTTSVTLANSKGISEMTLSLNSSNALTADAPIISTGAITGTDLVATDTSTPTSTTACTQGEMHSDDSYLYVCTSALTYKKVALSSL